MKNIKVQTEPMEPEVEEPVINVTNALEQLNRADIDIQITTAHRFPRSITKFLDEAISMATVDIETAESCFYKLPPRGGKDIPPGPSIRCAEIAQASYRNLRVATRIVDVGDKTVTAQGICHDLERNVAVSVEVSRRITTKDGRRYGDDMITMTMNAAAAIARRNALFSVIPRSFVNQIFNRAMEVAVGDASTLVSRRDRLMETYTKMGVNQVMILKLLGKKGLEDIDIEDLKLMTGLKTAIKEGMTTVDEAFAEDESDTRTPTERLADLINGKKPEPQPEPSEKDKSGLFKSDFK